MALRVLVLLQVWWSDQPPTPRRSPVPDDGQASAEYALVLLAAATVALALITWATRTGKLGAFFDAVVDRLLSKVA